MYITNYEISDDTQWKLNIVQRNLRIPNWIDLIPEAQEQMLNEVIGLSEELPLSIYQNLTSALGKLIQHSPAHLKPVILEITSN
ncbi:MAG: hypothetical protein AAFY20_17750 [Cyanobacteria bacterium J06639_14]